MDFDLNKEFNHFVKEFLNTKQVTINSSNTAFYKAPLALFWATPFTKILDAPAQRGVGVKRGEVEFKKKERKEIEKKKTSNQPEPQHFSTGEHITPAGKRFFFKFGQGRKDRRRKRKKERNPPSPKTTPDSSLVISLRVHDSEGFPKSVFKKMLSPALLGGGLAGGAKKQQQPGSVQGRTRSRWTVIGEHW